MSDRVAGIHSCRLVVAVAKLSDRTNFKPLSDQDPPKFVVGSGAVRRANEPFDTLEPSALCEPVQECGESRQRALSATVNVSEIHDQSGATSTAFCKDLGRTDAHNNRSANEDERVKLRWRQGQQFV